MIWCISSMQICGEHKDSGILRHGFFASPYQGGLTDVESEVKEKYKGGSLLDLLDMVTIVRKHLWLVKSLLYCLSIVMWPNLVQLKAVFYLFLIF